MKLKIIIAIFMFFTLVGCSSNAEKENSKENDKEVFFEDVNVSRITERDKTAYDFINTEILEDFNPLEENQYTELNTFDLKSNGEKSFYLPYFGNKLMDVNEEYLIYSLDSSNYGNRICVLNTKSNEITFIPFEEYSRYINVKDEWIYLIANTDQGDSLVRYDLNSGKKEELFEIEGRIRYSTMDENRIYFNTDSYKLYSIRFNGEELRLIHKNVESFRVHKDYIYAISFLNNDFREDAHIHRINVSDNTEMKLYSTNKAGTIIYADGENVLTSIYSAEFILFNEKNPEGKSFDHEYVLESGICTYHVLKGYLYQMASDNLIKFDLASEKKQYVPINERGYIPFWDDEYVFIFGEKNQVVNLKTNEEIMLEDLIDINEIKICLFKKGIIYYKVLH